MANGSDVDLGVFLKAIRRMWFQVTGQGEVAAVYDTFDALDGFETKSGQVPILVKKLHTGYAWRRADERRG